MSNTEMIFRNSKDIIQNGKDNDCKGLLYCGKKYTSNGGCPCLSCDGICGMDNAPLYSFFYFIFNWRNELSYL